MGWTQIPITRVGRKIRILVGRKIRILVGAHNHNLNMEHMPLRVNKSGGSPTMICSNTCCINKERCFNIWCNNKWIKCSICNKHGTSSLVVILRILPPHLRKVNFLLKQFTNPNSSSSSLIGNNMKSCQAVTTLRSGKQIKKSAQQQ